jgi:hypothetical protein
LHSGDDRFGERRKVLDELDGCDRAVDGNQNPNHAWQVTQVGNAQRTSRCVERCSADVADDSRNYGRVRDQITSAR